MATICLDISTAPIENAAEFIEDPRPPGNYKKPEAIADWVAAEKAERLSRAGLDLDLCRVTGIATHDNSNGQRAMVCQNEQDEGFLIKDIGGLVKGGAQLVTYNGRSFDIPVLKRRARYLGVAFPDISTDKFKSPIVDLMTLLSDNDPQRRRSLSFYCKRLCWTDLCDKPLSGADEANVPHSGRWAELEASLRRDVEAIRRLSLWLGVI